MKLGMLPPGVLDVAILREGIHLVAGFPHIANYAPPFGLPIFKLLHPLDGEIPAASSFEFSFRQLRVRSRVYRNRHNDTFVQSRSLKLECKALYDKGQEKLTRFACQQWLHRGGLLEE